MNNNCIRVLADPVQIKECKKTLYKLEEQLNLATQIFNLSGNAARLKILFLLHKEGEMCPCDLSDILDISVGGISQHLRKLKDGKLVKYKKVGQTVFYSIVEDNIQAIRPVLDSLLNNNNKKESIS
ncbi:transcriptional regulator [Echinicola strongylocentroti]|uniref:Transcriptional regulator n=1 Tax=Echinicola strongylocentroti TaxID=1795355 RepID=A0A2Z4IG61_9BACT|nr:metalloregulator ArsR/SmtB family transcription factor [Echinicola strongylocentroti]AWW29478.1 transcriptional regulator [Echinicola strongylocentroti]